MNIKSLLFIAIGLLIFDSWREQRADTYQQPITHVEERDVLRPGHRIRPGTRIELIEGESSLPHAPIVTTCFELNGRYFIAADSVICETPDGDLNPHFDGKHHYWMSKEGELLFVE